jgi:hypothetical protein
MLRYPRYIPAVGFALLTLAFVGLWLRSYTWDDILLGTVGSNLGLQVESWDGVLTLMTYRKPDWAGWKLTGGLSDVEGWSVWQEPYLGFDYEGGGSGFVLAIPFWFIVPLLLALATFLAYKPITRFTVRGLLITTTLLAAVLGLAVFAV